MITTKSISRLAMAMAACMMMMAACSKENDNPTTPTGGQEAPESTAPFESYVLDFSIDYPDTTNAFDVFDLELWYESDSMETQKLPMSKSQEAYSFTINNLPRRARIFIHHTPKAGFHADDSTKYSFGYTFSYTTKGHRTDQTTKNFGSLGIISISNSYKGSAINSNIDSVADRLNKPSLVRPKHQYTSTGIIYDE